MFLIAFLSSCYVSCVGSHSSSFIAGKPSSSSKISWVLGWFSNWALHGNQTSLSSSSFPNQSWSSFGRIGKKFYCCDCETWTGADFHSSTGQASPFYPEGCFHFQNCKFLFSLSILKALPFPSRIKWTYTSCSDTLWCLSKSQQWSWSVLHLLLTRSTSTSLLHQSTLLLFKDWQFCKLPKRNFLEEHTLGYNLERSLSSLAHFREPFNRLSSWEEKNDVELVEGLLAWT